MSKSYCQLNEKKKKMNKRLSKFVMKHFPRMVNTLHQSSGTRKWISSRWVVRGARGDHPQ